MNGPGGAVSQRPTTGELAVLRRKKRDSVDEPARPSSREGSNEWSKFVKKILTLTLASAAMLAATPALAQDAVAPTGGRVEALVGYDKVKALGEMDGGVLFGIGAGYDFAVNRAVSIGADVEATESTQKERSGAIEVKAGRDLYAGGRVNFAVSPTANLYVKGGYTNARFKADDGIDSFSRNFDGYRLGAGGQLALSGKTYVGSEYRYSNYEDGLSRHQVALTVGTRF
jgi:outer membrane immunogenic protein